MKDWKKKRTIWLVASLLLVFSLAMAKEKYEEKFEKTLALAKDGKVDIGNISGNIVAMSWGQNQVKVEALKVSKADSLEKAKENAAKVKIEVTQEGSLVKIETKYPKGEKFGREESLNVSVDYKVWIPEKADIKAHSISGDVTADAIGGAADLKAISGGVHLTKAGGAVNCESISGEVEVSDVTGNAYLKSISGGIKATTIKGSVEAETVSGGVELTGISEASSVRAKALSGGVVYRGRINRQGNYNFKSHSGGVELYLPADSAFDFEADTFSGDIETDFEVKVMGKVSRKELSGTVNGGGATLKASSFSGGIKLKKT
jgi:DUF4097 and DUF4098 domain-containing protein YvlB